MKNKWSLISPEFAPGKPFIYSTDLYTNQTSSDKIGEPHFLKSLFIGLLVLESSRCSFIPAPTFKEFQKRKEKNMLEYYERFQDTRDESIEHDETKLLKGRNV